MQTFSIRDLRDRSGELTHEAEEGRMSLVTKHGQPLFVTLPFSEELMQHGVRKALAMSLLRSGDISIGKAAEISGVAYVDFLPCIKALGIYVVDGDATELADELKLLGG